jgi:hypothetical protein
MKTPKMMSQMVVNPRYLRHFASFTEVSNAMKWGKKVTYWKDEIHDIHDAQNQVSYFSLVVSVAREDQKGCHKVMREHLPIVLSSLLNIDDEDLLQPEGVLD